MTKIKERCCPSLTPLTVRTGIFVVTAECCPRSTTCMPFTRHCSRQAPWSSRSRGVRSNRTRRRRHFGRDGAGRTGDDEGHVGRFTVAEDQSSSDNGRRLVQGFFVPVVAGGVLASAFLIPPCPEQAPFPPLLIV